MCDSFRLVIFSLLPRHNGVMVQTVPQCGAFWTDTAAETSLVSWSRLFTDFRN